MGKLKWNSLSDGARSSLLLALLVVFLGGLAAFSDPVVGLFVLGITALLIAYAYIDQKISQEEYGSGK
jgi:hypothetical protein